MIWACSHIRSLRLGFPCLGRMGKDSQFAERFGFALIGLDRNMIPQGEKREKAEFSVRSATGSVADGVRSSSSTALPDAMDLAGDGRPVSRFHSCR